MADRSVNYKVTIDDTEFQAAVQRVAVALKTVGDEVAKLQAVLNGLQPTIRQVTTTGTD